MFVNSVVNRRTPMGSTAAALLASAATLAGVGAVAMAASGALLAGAATLAGVGITRSTGTGALLAQAATVAGAGTAGNMVAGSGALLAQSAVIAGSGITRSTGSGVLLSGAASLAGAGAVTSTITGSGLLASGTATVAGTGTVAYATSYANAGGTGDRRTTVILIGTTKQPGGGAATDLIDGTTSNSYFFDSGDLTGNGISFDFSPTGFYQIINEMRWKQNTTSLHGTWSWQGFNGTSWIDITTGISLGGTNGTQTITLTNSTQYIVYRLVQTAGNISSSPFIQEIEFKIAQGAAISAVSTSYSNTGGTGARTGVITATTTMSLGAGTAPKLVDGTTGANDLWWQAQLGGEWKFDFGTAKTINEFRFKQTNSAVHREWVIRGSNDDSTYVDLGGWFILGGATTSTFKMGDNQVAYRYYKLVHLDGNSSSSPFLDEIEFKIS